jgi:protein gp37
MGEKTGIEWTDHTFNPWIGCQKVSPGCAHCYAETLAANRMGLKVWGPAATTHRTLTSDTYWKQPIRWNKKAQEAGRRERVFCASMADVFEDHPEVAESRMRLWGLIEDTPMLNWLLLTKRPENIERMLPERWDTPDRPPRNLWLGISAENQDQFMARWPVLEHVGRYRISTLFLSLEPLLGPIDIEPAFEWHETPVKWGRGVDWVIAGGESGPGCRPMDLAWVRSIRDQCEDQEIPFFFKQHGGTRKIDGVWGGHRLDGRVYQAWPPEPSRQERMF